MPFGYDACSDGRFLNGVTSPNDLPDWQEPQLTDLSLDPRPESPPAASTISRKIVQIHARLFGRGPTKAKTYVERDYALTVLEEIFTPAEHTLVEAGKGDHVFGTRRAFQEAVQDEFIEIVEEALGRKVRAFVSQVHLRRTRRSSSFCSSRPIATTAIPPATARLPARAPSPGLAQARSIAIRPPRVGASVIARRVTPSPRPRAADRSRTASSTARITTFISSSAKLAPRQRRTPPPNGIHS